MLTREEAEAIYDAGKETVIKVLMDLSARVDQLEKEVADLKAQLNKNSSNSSKPPSSDGLAKPTPQQKPDKKNKRKPGGQPNHPGNQLEKSPTPDHTIHHQVHQCRRCGHSLHDEAAEATAAHQVFDLPEKLFEITEHQTECKTCSQCGTKTQSHCPPEAQAKTQYGPRTKALITHWHYSHFLPYKRITELFNETFKQRISQGFIYTTLKEAYRKLESFSQQTYNQLVNSPVAHFDETGMRYQNQNRWLHVACTQNLTYFYCDSKRGAEGMERMGLLKDFTGVAVHDGWESYYQFECEHSLCNAHILRDLQGIIERENQYWAQQMADHLRYVKKKVDQAKRDGLLSLPEADQKRLRKQYRHIIEWGWRANPPPSAPGKRGRVAQGPMRNLWKRLDNQESEILRFMSDFRVPFDNNQAERDIRMAKLRQKISNCFRGREAMHFFCRVRSYLSTLRKRGFNPFEQLFQLFRGDEVGLAFAETPE